MGGGRLESVSSLAGGQGFALDTPEAIRNFTLSVGDTFNVNVWGQDLRFSQTFAIPFEGKIFLPQVGEIPVNGLTTAQVKARVSSILAKRHPGLSVSVLLVSTRPVKVFVTGIVNRPGTVTIPALSRLSVALDAAGGIPAYGSSRKISISRSGLSTPFKVDYYRFILKGDVEGNPLLKAGDVVSIPPLSNLAAINGNVNRPGNYEFLQGDTVADLLEMAHGLKADAAPSDASIVNLKGLNRADRVEKKVDLSNKEGLSRKLQPLDRIFVPSNTLSYVDLSRTRVSVVGAVGRPGTYILTIGTRLRDALAAAGGPKPGSGLQEVRIYHKVASGETRFFDEPDRVNVYKLLFEKDESQNIDLQDGDLILVPDSKDLAEDSVVYVYGQVGKPGKVPYRAGDRLSDYLNKAGGPTDKAGLRRVNVTRAFAKQSLTVDAYVILKEGQFEKDPELKPGDIVNVPEEFFYFSNFQDVVNFVLATAAVASAIINISSLSRSLTPTTQAR
jgi:protein involved in polysaccharide export with SLBB domain